MSDNHHNTTGSSKHKNNTEQEQQAKVKEREAQEKAPTSSEKALTQKERATVAQHGNLSALTVYSIILREGEQELRRPKASLWWSGLAAGIGISTSVLVEAIIRASLGAEHPYLNLLQSVGYSFGFVLVILSRLQLFTENTITVVLPVLAEPTRQHFYRTARLWALVLTANLVGTFLTAALSTYGRLLSDETLMAIIEISQHLAHLSPPEAFLRAIPSGFFIAAMVWMLPSAKGAEVLVIVMFTWLIAAGGFTHVVAGSHEIFTLVLYGELSLFTALAFHITPVLFGNILGGTGLFAMLAYGQVHEEI